MPTVRTASTDTIGPWPLGLNELPSYDQSLDERDISDAELIFCDNYEIMDDGALRPRRGVHYTSVHNTDGDKWDYTLNSGTIRGINILGTIVDGDDEYVFMHARVSGESHIWYALNPTPAGFGSWILGHIFPGTTETLNGVVLYQDVLYFMHNGTGGSSGGGYSAPVSDMRAGTLLTMSTVANMKRGHFAFTWKDRMWVVNTTEQTVFYSKATDFTVWAAPDGGFFKVPVTNEPVLVNDQLYLFHDRESHKFSFNSDPGVDGYLQLLNPGLGGQAVFEQDRMYIVTHSGLYQIVNDNFINISTGRLNDRSIEQVGRPFVLGSHVYFCWKSNQVWQFYSLNIKTGGFAKLTFHADIDNNEGWQKVTRWSNDTSTNSRSGVMIQPAAGGFAKHLYYMLDDPDFVVDFTKQKENRVPQYRILTKLYDFGDRFTMKKFKRVLFDGVMLDIKNIFDELVTCWVMNTWINLTTVQNIGSKYSEVALHDGTNVTQEGDQSFGYVRGLNIQLSFEPSNYVNGYIATNLGLNNHTTQQANQATIRRFIVDYVPVSTRRPS